MRDVYIVDVIFSGKICFNLKINPIVLLSVLTVLFV